MNDSSYLKIAFGILLAVPALPLMAGFPSTVVYVIGSFMVVVGMVLFVSGIRKIMYVRPELKEFPGEVVINGVHYPNHIFERVNVFAKGGETVFAIKELRQVTGISAEEAKEVIKNWKQYYRP